MKFGSPDKKQSSKKNYFSIKKGTQVFRILPPLGNLADKGIWNRYYAVHFGYKTTQGYLRPFVSPEVVNRATKMVEVRDAAKDYINSLLSAKEQIKERLLTNPNSAPLKAQLEKTEELLQTYNLEKRYYVNAMDQNGNIGLLKLKTREKNALDAAREQIKQEEGVDPIGVVGAYLTFTKHGDGRDTSVLVSAHNVTKNVNGQQFKTLNTHDLSTDSVTIAKLETEAFDLDNIQIRPTAEEVEMMVKEGPTAVDAVMSKYRTAPTTKKETSAPSSFVSNPQPEIDLDEPMPEDDTDFQSAPQESTKPSSSEADDDLAFLKGLGIG